MSDSSSSSIGSSPTTVKSGFLRREEVLGKSVLGLDAVLVGTVRDLAISKDGKIAIQVEPSGSHDGEEIFVNPEEILAIGEVVLLRHSSASIGKSASIQTDSTLTSSSAVFASASHSSDSPGKICNRCSYMNNTNSKFCIKCGNHLF